MAKKTRKSKKARKSSKALRSCRAELKKVTAAARKGKAGGRWYWTGKKWDRTHAAKKSHRTAKQKAAAAANLKAAKKPRKKRRTAKQKAATARNFKKMMAGLKKSKR